MPNAENDKWWNDENDECRTLHSPFLAFGIRHLALSVGGGENRRRRRMLPLAVADERPADRPVLIDEKPRRPRDVQRVEADAVPDAVGAHDVAPLVDQDVER